MKRFATALTCFLMLQFAAGAVEVLSRRVIADDGYCGWPTVCLRSNGELIVVYSGDRVHHVDPWGKVRMIRSSDLGETWTSPVTPVSTILDDRDAGMIELQDGSLMLFWFNSTAWMDNLDKNKLWDGAKNIEIPEAVLLHTRKLPALEELEKVKGVFSAVSRDGGVTWSRAARLVGSAPHGGIQMKDDGVLHVGCDYDPDNRGVVVERYNPRKDRWKVVARLSWDPEIDIKACYEPHLAECPDGKIVAMCRYQGKGSGEFMVQSESPDGGRTWSSLHRTSLYGYPPHFLNLPDGRLMVTYARRRAPDYGQYVAISDDGAKTWGEEMLIDKGFDPDNGYPSTVLLPDGTFLTVYYGAPEADAGKKIIAVRWKL